MIRLALRVSSVFRRPGQALGSNGISEAHWTWAGDTYGLQSIQSPGLQNVGSAKPDCPPLSPLREASNNILETAIRRVSLKQIPVEERRDGMGTLDSIWAAGRCEFGTMGDFVGAGRARSVFCHLRGE